MTSLQKISNESLNTFAIILSALLYLARKKMRFTVFILCVLSAVFALDNGVGLTPPLGFNTWNHFGCNINENVMRQAADLIVRLGLDKVGYKYINIDDCWMASQRSAQGELVPDPKRFPNGIKNLADYVHQLGLKLGIYSSAGTKTCQGLPASLDHEDIDARIWAQWGIDYLKYDNCYHDARSSKERYTRMRDALNKTGRPMYYSICNWGEEKISEYGNSLGNSWRTTGDIEDRFESVRSIFKQNHILAKYAQVGGWNDPDMLEVGNGGLSVVESRTHFALWAAAKSPMLLGCDLTKIKDFALKIISNNEIIAVNQDKRGIQAVCTLNCKDEDFSGSATKAQVFVGGLENNAFVVTVTNWNNKDTFSNVKVNFAELKLPVNKYYVRDLWEKKTLGLFMEHFIVPKVDPHDTHIFKLTLQP